MSIELHPVVSENISADDQAHRSTSFRLTATRIAEPSDIRPTPSHDTNGTDGAAITSTTSVRFWSIVLSVSGVTLLNTFGQGLLISAIPQIARDLKIPAGQLFWPTAVASLTLGCLQLVVGQ